MARFATRFAIRFTILRPGRILPLTLAAFTITLCGCGRLEHQAKPDTVYVVSEQTYLRDRVAPVSTHVALVTNGEPLQVVERDGRFLKVKTAKGELGWIARPLVIEQPVYNEFVQLEQEHRNDRAVATGILRDGLYLHLRPARDSERFYLLPANGRLQLLMRASIPKPTAGYLPAAKPSIPAAPATPVPMENWWLVRAGPDPRPQPPE